MHHLSPQDRTRAIAALIAAVVLWGSAFVGIRAVVASGAYSPGELSFARLFVASIALGAIALMSGGVRLPSRREIAPLFALGFLGQMLYQLLLNTGERTVDAGTASLIVSSAPLFASALAVALLGERMGTLGWVGSALGFAGAATIAASAGLSLEPGSGALLVVAATLVWAAYLVIQKSVSARFTPLELTAWPMWIGTVLLLPWAAGVPRAVVSAPVSATFAVVWLGVMASVAGFLVWSYAMKRLPVVVASNALFTVPAAAFVIGLVVLGEHPEPLAMVGAALSIAGVVLAQSKGSPVRSRSAEIADAEAA